MRSRLFWRCEREPFRLSQLSHYLCAPVLDVGILAFLIYRTYLLLVMTDAVYLIRGLFILAAIYGAAFFLNLSTVTWIMNFIAPGLVIGIAIILQPELRRIFIQLGKQSIVRKKCFPYFLDRCCCLCCSVSCRKKAWSTDRCRAEGRPLPRTLRKGFSSMHLFHQAFLFPYLSTTIHCMMGQ